MRLYYVGPPGLWTALHFDHRNRWQMMPGCRRKWGKEAGSSSGVADGRFENPHLI